MFCLVCILGIIGNDRGPDLLAMILVVAVCLMVCLGSRRSTNFNIAFSMFNFCVIVFVVCYVLYTNPMKRAKILFDQFSRTKTLTGDTTLKRCWNQFDIVFFGVGNMIGAGLYIRTGEVAQSTGPAIFLSYALAGVAAFLSALCYAEMEGRLPSAGSSYSFTYYVIGELCAFLIGWDMILKSMISSAALAKAWSKSFDLLTDNQISKITVNYIGKIPEAASIIGNDRGPDFLAMILVVAVCLMVCLGSRRSTNFNIAFSMFNFCVIVFVVCYGLYMKEDTYWSDPATCNSTNKSSSIVQNSTMHNAFMPNGLDSIIEGASKVYFAYIGFDHIAAAGAETKKPHQSLPYGTVISMIIVIIAYVFMSATLTLLIPYCEISKDSPFPLALLTRYNVINGISNDGGKYIKVFVSIGALSAMTTVLFGNLFVLPRIVYSMASDGVLFQYFTKLLPKAHVPGYMGIVVFGSITAVFAVFLTFETLIETTSLGMLFDYTIVSICVILLRYRRDDRKRSIPDTTPSVTSVIPGELKPKYLFLGKFLPNKTIPCLILLLISFLFGAAMVVIYGWRESTSPWYILLITVFGCCSLFLVFAIHAHEPSKAVLHFKVPLVPILPAVSLFLNIGLMVNIQPASWLRFAVWISLGFVIYLVYGLNHSNHKQNKRRTSNPPSPPEQNVTTVCQPAAGTVALNMVYDMQ